MAEKIDITGQVYGRLTVLRRVKGAHWLCRCKCGNEKTVVKGNMVNGTVLSCGCIRREMGRKLFSGSNNPCWNGGPEIRNDYRHVHNVYLPDGTFKKNITEHVYLMMWHLKRRLHDGETVHHRNGIRCDNSFDNLELRVASHPHGQSIPDMIAWAKTLLQRYEPESLC